MHRQTRLAQLVVRPASGDRHSRPSRRLTAALLGDEVEPVLDRVHEQHVVALHPGDRAGKSSRVSSTIGVQSRVAQRSFTRRPPARSRSRTPGTRARPCRDGYSIATNTTRPRSPGRVSSRRSYAEEPAHDVLRRFDAVGARDHEPVADDVVERAPRRPRRMRPTASSAATSGPRLRGERGDAAFAPEHLARRWPRTRGPTTWCGSRRRAAIAAQAPRRRRRAARGCRRARRTACA